jgi:hypothetical protein
VEEIGKDEGGREDRVVEMDWTRDVRRMVVTSAHDVGRAYKENV